MKNIIFGFLLLFATNSLLYSQSDIWLSFGYEYGYYMSFPMELIGKWHTSVQSSGFNFNLCNFAHDKKIGYFISTELSFLFGSDQYNNLWASGGYNGIRLGIIMGPGFRHDFNERIKLKYGIGLNPKLTLIIPHNFGLFYNLAYFNLGISGDIGIKYDINNHFYLNMGSILSYDFIDIMFFWNAIPTGFNTFGIRPYICIGFNL